MARQATFTETWAAKSLKRSASSRPSSGAKASSTKPWIFSSSRRTVPGVKKREIFERSSVCSGGSIMLIMGVTGWTLVSRCEVVVPFAAE